MRTLALHSLILPAAVNNSRDGIKSRKQLHFCAPPPSGSTCSYDRPTLAESLHCKGIKGDEIYKLFFSPPDWPLFIRLLLLVLCIRSLFVHAHGSVSGGEGEVGNQPAVRPHHEPSLSPCGGLVCVRNSNFSPNSCSMKGLSWGGGLNPPGVPKGGRGGCLESRSRLG